jgi:TetR/AcrR family transcriptional regulator, regulator of cefoperazone and chloramphenicol sensitivity
MNRIEPASGALEPTRERLLQAAVEIFARRGFRGATVREICARAEVNLASVNYHFRSKEALYSQALSFAFREAERRYPMGAARDQDCPPTIRLNQFVKVFLARLLDNSSLGDHGRLIAAEIANPTKALDEVIANWIRPQLSVLREIMEALVGPGRSETEIQRFVLSLLGQCLVYKHSRSVIDRICPEVIDGPEQIERCAEHIARFSLAAIGALAAEPETLS